MGNVGGQCAKQEVVVMVEEELVGQGGGGVYHQRHWGGKHEELWWDLCDLGRVMRLGWIVFRALPMLKVECSPIIPSITQCECAEVDSCH